MMATLAFNELSNFKPFTSNFEGWTSQLTGADLAFLIRGGTGGGGPNAEMFLLGLRKR